MLSLWIIVVEWNATHATFMLQLILVHCCICIVRAVVRVKKRVVEVVFDMAGRLQIVVDTFNVQLIEYIGVEVLKNERLKLHLNQIPTCANSSIW